MSKASLELGGGNWAAKEGNLLGYAQGNESDKFIPREFSFTRAADIAATRINSSGLIEKYRENLLLQSNQFDTTWVKNPSNVSITSGFSGYDGSNNAWKLEAVSDNNYSVVNQLVSSTGVETFSVYAKAGTSNFFRIQVTGGTNTSASYFDLSGSGSVGINFNNIDAKIESVGNGWFRCSVTGNKTTSSNCVIFVLDANGSTNVTTGANVYIQDAQLERGLVATSYLESGATTATSGVADNEPRIDYAGGTASLLLEPSRTNSWIHSEYLNYSFSQIVATTITQNTTETLSPEGLYNATKLEGIGSWIFKDFLAGTDTGTWTVSCWVKAVNPSSNNTFRLSVSGNNFSSNLTATNDWQKFSFSVTNGGATAAGLQRDTSANDADLYIYGLQVEAGSYATSYIPTYGTSVTRVEDFNNSNDIVANPIVFGANDDFTLYYEGSFDELGNNMLMGGGNSGISDGSGRSYWWVTNTNMLLKGAGEISIANVAFTPAKNTNYKLLVKRNGSQVDFYIDGTKISTNQQTTNTPFTLRSVGWSYNKTVYQVRGNIKQVKVFSTALSDREAVDLTSPYSTYQELVTAEGLTWESPTCTTNSITELQSI